MEGNAPPPPSPRSHPQARAGSARGGGARCRNFREAMETVAGPAFKMFLGVSAVLEAWAPDGSACTLRLADNPLADFVELPPTYSELRYSSLLCGVIRGALEMVRAAPRVVRPRVRPAALTRHPFPPRAPAPIPRPQVSVRVDCRFVKDVLNGDDTTEMRVTVKEVLADVAGSDYKDD